MTRRSNFAPIVALHIRALTDSLAQINPKEAEKAKELLAVVLDDLHNISQDASLSEQTQRDATAILHLVITHLVSLCWQEAVVKKLAGYYGLQIFISNSTHGWRYIQERQGDVMKACIAIIKDTPADICKNINDVAESFLEVIRICIKHRQDAPPGVTPASLPGAGHPLKKAYVLILQNVMVELPGPNSLMRETVQSALEILAEVNGRSVPEELLQFRDPLLSNIYSRPLRALPLQRQIGNVDTITYLLNLRPSIPPINDELWRMLGEALAVADTDNDSYTAQGDRPPQRHMKNLVTKLRVSCLKLLTASMYPTEFYNGQATMRSRFVNLTQLH